MLLLEALCYHLVDLFSNCLLLGWSEKLGALLCKSSSFYIKKRQATTLPPLLLYKLN